MICHKRLIRHLILLIWLLGLPFPVYAQQALSDQALIEALRLGGYNLYFRHEATEWSQQDVVHQKDDWVSCDGAKIRQLSEQGRQRAKRTGEVMRNLKFQFLNAEDNGRFGRCRNQISTPASPAPRPLLE